MDYSEQEEGCHYREPGQVEEVVEVEEPDWVAEQVGVDNLEQQPVGDQEDSCLWNCEPGETKIACVKRHHCKRMLLS